MSYKILPLMAVILLIGCTEDCNPLNTNIDTRECRRNDNIFETLNDARAERDRYRNLADQHNSTISGLETRIDGLETERDNLQADIEALNTTNTNLERTNTNLETDNTELKALLDSLTESVNITHQLFLISSPQTNWTQNNHSAADVNFTITNISGTQYIFERVFLLND